MPLYDYQSEDGRIMEMFYHMKDDKPATITHNDVVYTRVFSVPNAITDSKKPKTIGELADKNTEKAIKEGKRAKPKEKEKPWWRTKKKPDLSLAKMTKKQQEKYIVTGKK